MNGCTLVICTHPQKPTISLSSQASNRFFWVSRQGFHHPWLWGTPVHGKDFGAAPAPMTINVGRDGGARSWASKSHPKKGHLSRTLGHGKFYHWFLVSSMHSIYALRYYHGFFVVRRGLLFPVKLGNVTSSRESAMLLSQYLRLPPGVSDIQTSCPTAEDHAVFRDLAGCGSQQSFLDPEMWASLLDTTNSRHRWFTDSHWCFEIGHRKWAENDR